MAYEVDFLAVGDGERSGDAIALRLGNLQGHRKEQTVVVIDGGFQDSGERLVNLIRRYYGTEDVDLAICTHPDADHAGGLVPVLERLRVGRLWMHQPWNHTDDIARVFRDGRVTDESVSAALRRDLEDARSLETLAIRKRIPIVEPFTGTEHGNGQILVLGPAQEYYESLLPAFRSTPEPKAGLSAVVQRAREFVRTVAENWNFETLDDTGETSAENNSSTILLVAGDDGFLVFTADAGVPALDRALSVLDRSRFNYSNIKFIQVPHHGSDHNVGPTMLNKLLGPRLTNDERKKTAFVSVSRDAAPRHPSKKVTNAFRRRGAPVYATQGVNIRHHHDAPPRSDYTDLTPLPFYNQVEE